MKSRSIYSPMFAWPADNKCFSIIFFQSCISRRSTQRTKRRNHRCNCWFAYTYAALVLLNKLAWIFIDCESICTLQKINSSGLILSYPISLHAIRHIRLRHFISTHYLTICCEDLDTRPWLATSCFPFACNYTPPCCFWSTGSSPPFWPPLQSCDAMFLSVLYDQSSSIFDVWSHRSLSSPLCSPGFVGGRWSEAILFLESFSCTYIGNRLASLLLPGPQYFAALNCYRVTWSGPSVSDRSPKPIDCQGLGESRPQVGKRIK